jgi:hypothetical protein
MDKRLGGSQSRSGRDGEEEDSQTQPGIEIPNTDHPARSQNIAILDIKSFRNLSFEDYLK